MASAWLGNAIEARKPKAREIIAIDIDNFYVAAERLQDPSLVGRPVAVQQKNICATTSYEARAFGVDKLCLIKDAKQRCPELVIVNGEDLTKYRQYSRRIFRLVKGIFSGNANVEKLGMDELFIDVTGTIDGHMRDIASGVRGSTQTFFNLDSHRTETSARIGFFYKSDSISGHFLPNEGSQVEEDRRLAIASHLAAHIRDRIHSEIGFSTSAGVAHNKVLAKLLASKNKPAKQTTWQAATSSIAVQDFLDPYVLSKIPSFGFRTLTILRHKIFKEPLTPAGQWTNAPEHTHPYEYEGQLLERKAAYEQHRLTAHTGLLDLQEQALNSSQPMTVEIARQALSSKDLQEWFDPTIGARLWGLLHGIDFDPVSMAPDFPATVSVEDTYFGFPSIDAVNKATLCLTLSLLNRLELEFVDEPMELACQKTARGTRKRAFVRFATQLRLTTRYGRSNRTSKAVTFPTDAYDLTRSKQDRADALFKSTLQLLLQQATEGKDLQDLRLINLAAVNFNEEAPPASVKSALASKGSAKRHLEADWTDLHKDSIDPDVLRELPDDVREELLRQLGLKKAKAKGQQSVQNYFTKKKK